MKVGRYVSNGQTRVFVVNNMEQLVDTGVLEDSQAAPASVRVAAEQARLSNRGFCDALPVLEKYLLQFPDALAAGPCLGSTVEFDSPTRPGTFICIGLNYRDHAAESKMELPKSPLLFSKTANAINAHNQEVPIPCGSAQVDFEAELAVVIGKTCRHVKRDHALQYIAGFTCGNDISARDFQFADGQWYRGKSCDGFGPLGPWIVTPSEIPDPHNLRIQLRLNGKSMQDSSTSNLVFNVPALIEHISSVITLEPGDVILTGTPFGVGFSRKPPLYLRHGDVVEVEIEDVGILVNTIS